MSDLTLDVDVDHKLANAEARGIEPDEADFYLPLTSSEVSTLKMALNLAQIRVSQEGDTENEQAIGQLLIRADWHGLFKDSDYEFAEPSGHE